MTVQNLDAACAKLGEKLAAGGTKDTENSITKALGVLEEQGVYALFLYLHAREKDWGKKTSAELATFLREQPSKQNALLGTIKSNEPFDALQQLREITFHRGPPEAPHAHPSRACRACSARLG